MCNSCKYVQVLDTNGHPTGSFIASVDGSVDNNGSDNNILPPLNLEDKIDSFTGEYNWLSNSYLYDVEGPDGIIYPSVAHAFQAAKASSDSDKEEICLMSLRDAQRFGKKLPLPENWDDEKYDIMLDLVRQKFDNDEDEELRYMLLLTGNKKLIQGGMRKDQYWGVDRNGVGQNKMGEILMQVRSELKAKGTPLDAIGDAVHNVSSVLAGKFDELIDACKEGDLSAIEEIINQLE